MTGEPNEARVVAEVPKGLLVAGGVKASGLGREGGPTGIEEFLETKYVGIAM